YEGIALYTSQRSFGDQGEEYNHFKGKSLQEFLTENDVENNQKAKSLLNIIDEVFDEYIKADKTRIIRTNNQIRTLNIIGKTFNKIADEKDEQIAYLKARQDNRYASRHKNFGNSEIDDNGDLFDNLTTLKNELQSIVVKDTKDIENALALCNKMEQVVLDIFGNNLKLEKKADDMKKIIYESKFCKNCGTKLQYNKKFCYKCGVRV
ncbi:MAG: zinc ribbon domain-containing protein, partial [Treponemataceae bacterium]